MGKNWDACILNPYVVVSFMLDGGLDVRCNVCVDLFT